MRAPCSLRQAEVRLTHNVWSHARFPRSHLTGWALAGQARKQAFKQASAGAASSQAGLAEVSWLQTRGLPSFRIKAVPATRLAQQRQACSPQASLTYPSAAASPVHSATSGLSGSQSEGLPASQQGAARLWAAAASAAAKTATSRSTVSSGMPAVSQSEVTTPGVYHIYRSAMRVQTPAHMQSRWSLLAQP